MNNYSANTINEIHVTNQITGKKRNDYIEKCSLDKKLFLEYYIYEINKTINGDKKSYRFEIDKMICDNKVISQNFNHSS